MVQEKVVIVTGPKSKAVYENIKNSSGKNTARTREGRIKAFEAKMKSAMKNHTNA